MVTSRLFILRRPLLVSATYSKVRYVSTKSCDPLRILFCGSDTFSIASLKALCKERANNPETIASIDVVCRPGKRVGRGLKLIREAPIKAVAAQLSLPIHEIDTFTGWKPPQPQGDPINLIIAVSFGLFVPPRILNAAKYGGLNVHPSLLPDFRGPAPLHHTLLAGETRTGVTLQTLDTREFDHGVILDQTPPPGFNIPNPDTCDVPRLLDLVSNKGAQMLVDGIRNRVFVPPLKGVGWHKPGNEAALRHAGKISPEDRHINWSSWTAQEINRRQRALGLLWSNAVIGADSPVSANNGQKKRVIFTKMELDESCSLGGLDSIKLDPGVIFALPDAQTKADGLDRPLYVTTCDRKIFRIDELRVQDRGSAPAYRAAKKAKLLNIQPMSSPMPTTFFAGLE
ncbi:methionyl-tRNA formyltransferase [[Emmonsia] crescens]|uniref:methionyl-tRNA formyltransferase n=1 Tax=[Emmonsia] crescens TaxID=73230 RepID=A0A0G2I774_9EURO|nr:methionyl-tRNA formyltransferase [Emmonsia crescens UAMH 3008]